MSLTSELVVSYRASVSAAVGGGMAGVATSATVDIVTLTTDAVIDDGAIDGPRPGTTPVPMLAAAKKF